tara:strand:- start:963 stop:1661 length:699 start_codon:yes stop_codon:yes gene_type:complete
MFQKENISLYVPLDYLLTHNKIPNKSLIIHLFISLNIGIVSDIYYNYDMYHRPTGMYIYFDHFYSSNNSSWVINEMYGKYVKIVFDNRNTYMKCYLNRYHYRIQKKITNSSIYNDYSIINMYNRIQNKIFTNGSDICIRPLLKRSYHITNQYAFYISKLLDIYNDLINSYIFLRLENDKNYQHITNYNIYSMNHELHNFTKGVKVYNDKKNLQKKVYEVIMDIENKLGCSFS